MMMIWELQTSMRMIVNPVHLPHSQQISFSNVLYFIIKHCGLIFLCCDKLFHNLAIYLFNVPGISSAELAALNESLQDLLDGIQVCIE